MQSNRSFTKSMRIKAVLGALLLGGFPLANPAPTPRFTQVVGTDPAASGHPRFVFLESPAVGGDSIAFEAEDSIFQERIYLADLDGDTIEGVIDSSTPVPGGVVTFELFSAPSLDGDRMAFWGTGPAFQEAIYLLDLSQDTIEVVVDQGTAFPGGSETFTDLGAPSLDAGAVAFHGEGSGFHQEGIYLADLGADTLETVVDLETPVPGGSGTFTGFGDPSLSNGRVAFKGEDSLFQDGIYIAEAGGVRLERVVTEASPIPEGTGTFTGLSHPALAGDLVAFRATNSAFRAGLYLAGGAQGIFRTSLPGHTRSGPASPVEPK